MFINFIFGLSIKYCLSDPNNFFTLVNLCSFLFQIIVEKLEEIGNNTHIKPEIQSLQYLLEQRLENKPCFAPTEQVGTNNTENVNEPSTNAEITVDDDIKRAVLQLFGPKPTEQPENSRTSQNGDIQSNVNEHLGRSVFGSKLFESSTTVTPKLQTEKLPCSLIDVRAGFSNCEDMLTPVKNSKLKSNINENLGKSVLGSKHLGFSTTVTPKLQPDKPPCSLLDIRAGFSNCEDILTPIKNSKLKKKGHMKRRRRPKFDVRFDGDSEDEDDWEDDVDESMTTTTDLISTTENIQENEEQNHTNVNNN